MRRLSKRFATRVMQKYRAIAAEFDGLTGRIREQSRAKHLSPGRLAAHETEIDRLHARTGTHHVKRLLQCARPFGWSLLSNTQSFNNSGRGDWRLAMEFVTAGAVYRRGRNWPDRHSCFCRDCRRKVRIENRGLSTIFGVLCLFVADLSDNKCKLGRQFLNSALK